MHGSGGDVAGEVGVAAVHPKMRQCTELGGVIQEVERERGGAGCDGEQPSEKRQQWMRRRQRNPSHGLGVVHECGRLGAAYRPGLEDGGVGFQLVGVMSDSGCHRNRRALVTA